MSNAVTQANALLERNDVRGAAQLLQRAEQAGDGMAARELALWCLTGQLVRRNLATSRALFERAAALGDSYSAAVRRAFVAGGVGGPSDWAGALRLLREASIHDLEAAEQLRLIEAMEVDANGDPIRKAAFDTLCDAPQVRQFPSLFSAAECAYLIATAGPMLQPSVVVHPVTGKEVRNSIRTASAAGFPFRLQNPAIHALNRRLAAASRSDVHAGEPLQVLRYEPGEQYHTHSDALPNLAPAQQRVMTFLVYLNEDYEGGETAFPAAGLKVRGKTGDGLLFRNASPDGMPDPNAIHAGLPVTSGAKFIASRWIRANPLVVE
ncbi:MAG TPA: 2OG-Fe(II) oxygenase [Sphingomicrobium sp.]